MKMNSFIPLNFFENWSEQQLAKIETNPAAFSVGTVKNGSNEIVNFDEIVDWFATAAAAILGVAPASLDKSRIKVSVQSKSSSDAETPFHFDDTILNCIVLIKKTEASNGLVLSKFRRNKVNWIFFRFCRALGVKFCSKNIIFRCFFNKIEYRAGEGYFFDGSKFFHGVPKIEVDGRRDCLIINMK